MDKETQEMKARLPRLLVSVSGGRTSALMAYLLFTRFKNDYEMVFVFANTSREKEETLLFVHQLEVFFHLPIVWVEAVVHHGGRKGCTHSITNYKDAVRDGSVFEEVIKKYGIPNKSFLHCTRELKTNPIRSYMRSIGWGDYKKYITVIGYRIDEKKRVDLEKAFEESQWYPLYDWQIKKSDVAAFWLKQAFDLQLADYDGNCNLCHKKSDRKLVTQIVTNPKDTWIDDMEAKYENFTPPTRTQCSPPYRFFRDNKSIKDLREMALDPTFRLAVDKSLDIDGADYDFDLDEQEDCAESCEPF